MRTSLCSLLMIPPLLSSLAASIPEAQLSDGTPRLSLPSHHNTYISKRNEWDDSKYFQEPGGDDVLGHYDSRFFQDVVSDEERVDSQIHMIRAYLAFFAADRRLHTWLAHGTLLGWWWNGKRLPWDADIDFQVSDRTLLLLSQQYNNTVHKYRSTDGTVNREYLLDVNPWIWERTKGNGANVIDARWIDVRNGLFIDITGLTEVHPEVSPGSWTCKNQHRYAEADLYPMRDTMFEGVRAKVPYNYDKILVAEYGEKALIKTIFNGHEWNPIFQEWIKLPTPEAPKGTVPHGQVDWSQW